MKRTRVVAPVRKWREQELLTRLCWDVEHGSSQHLPALAFAEQDRLIRPPGMREPAAPTTLPAALPIRLLFIAGELRSILPRHIPRSWIRWQARQKRLVLRSG
jgi:hypothetical protein